MFNFDGIDWFLPKYNEKQKIIESYNKRITRLIHCNHSWSKKEMDRIMVPMNLMYENN